MQTKATVVRQSLRELLFWEDHPCYDCLGAYQKYTHLDPLSSGAQSLGQGPSLLFVTPLGILTQAKVRIHSLKG